MKLFGLACALVGLSAAGLQQAGPKTEWVVFLSGNAQGYLAPCGCSAPMVGGVQRRATAIKALGLDGRTLLLENGGQVKSAGRQDEIKLETFAQMHAHSHGAGMNLGHDEAALGRGAVMSMARLSGGKLVSASIDQGDSVGVSQSTAAGPFLIAGLSEKADLIAANLGVAPKSIVSSALQLAEDAKRARKHLILLLDGDHTAAVNLARRVPSAALIQYRSSGRPPAKTERIGNVLLLSPGDGGRFIVRLNWKDSKFTSYLPVELHPGYKDDPGAKQIYKTYLARVLSEKLLEALPRQETDQYVGSEACGKCHSEAEKVWRGSKHAIALKTLEHEGHDRDPDCVECHVTGLASVYGFQSRTETPQLASVGCESCHGPGEKHSLHPKEVKMGTAGKASCMPCHRSENSPKFDFASYWTKVKHK